MSSVSEANVAARRVEETDPRCLREDLPIGKSGDSQQNYTRLRRKKAHTVKRTMSDETYDTPSEDGMTSSDVCQNALVTGGLKSV